MDILGWKSWDYLQSSVKGKFMLKDLARIKGLRLGKATQYEE